MDTTHISSNITIEPFQLHLQWTTIIAALLGVMTYFLLKKPIRQRKMSFNEFKVSKNIFIDNWRHTVLVIVVLLTCFIMQEEVKLFLGFDVSNKGGAYTAGLSIQSIIAMIKEKFLAKSDSAESIIQDK